MTTTIQATELAEFAQEHLSEHLHRSGSIFYSLPNALKAQDILVMGYNPGGDEGPALKKEIDAKFARTVNHYLDNWHQRKGQDAAGNQQYRESKQFPLQRRLQWLVGELGHSLETVCATNLIFFQSHRSGGVNHKNDSEVCWPVHERILAIVKPKIIVAIGNGGTSAYTALKQRLRSHEGFQEMTPDMASGHGSWKLRAFQVKLDGRSLTVLGFPHLSYYAVDSKRAYLEPFLERLQIRTDGQLTA